MGETKVITITREQFRDAISKATDNWNSIGKETRNYDACKSMLMTLQNIMFGSLLEEVLFEDKEEEN